jgi:ABC-type glutathione transport system ATPase component
MGLCLIRINNLTKQFKQEQSTPLTVLDNISLAINNNETLGLMGRIGSGKSTLGYCLLRLINSFSGEIYYNGVRVDNLSQRAFRKYRKKHQIVFQDSPSSLNPVFTIEEQIKEIISYYKIVPRVKINNFIDSALEEVGLSFEKKRQYPHELSTGEKQRVCIARALLTEPEFIVLDEITSSLDVINENKVLQLLKTIKQNRSISYLFITHHLGLATDFCDRIIFLENGKILFESDKTNSLDKLKSHFHTQKIFS